jgi:hypothetical protein
MEPEPFLIPDDFRAFMRKVVRRLDAPGASAGPLDSEDALRDETGYGGRIDGAELFRFTYLAKDGRSRWVIQVTESAIRDIADGLLIEVMGERIDPSRRRPKGHPLLIWGEYVDDALHARGHDELLRALDALHALAQDAPRMLRLWSATDDQIVAMLWRAESALYVVESPDGYASSCGDATRTDAFQLVDYDGQPFAVPYHDCIPWQIARDALACFVENGELGPAVRTEGRVPTGLLMMGEVDRAAALAARGEAPRTLARSSIPRLLAGAPPHEPTLDEELPPEALERGGGGGGDAGSSGGAGSRGEIEPHDTHELGGPLPPDELSAWARRLIDVLSARSLIEIGRVSLEEIAYQLGGLLQAHGAEAQRSPEAAEWLARQIGAVRGVDKMFATGGDLQIALRQARAG